MAPSLSRFASTENGDFTGAAAGAGHVADRHRRDPQPVADRTTTLMSQRTHSARETLPRVVATGFTTALLGDERHAAGVRGRGLRRARDAGARRERRSLPLQRQPRSAERPPVAGGREQGPEAHPPVRSVLRAADLRGSRSLRLSRELLGPLQGRAGRAGSGRLGIHPVVVDVHRVYERGHYGPVRAPPPFEHYRRDPGRASPPSARTTRSRNLYRVQCPQCSAHRRDRDRRDHPVQSVSYALPRAAASRTPAAGVTAAAAS